MARTTLLPSSDTRPDSAEAHRAATNRGIALLAEGKVEAAGNELCAALSDFPLSRSDRNQIRELIEGVWWSQENSDGNRHAAHVVVERVVAAVAADPILPLLVLYIRAVCELAWELTWDHRPILTLLRTATSTWEERRPVPINQAHDVAVVAMKLLANELLVESACSTGSLRDTHEWADTGHQELVIAVERARGLASSDLKVYLVDLLAMRRSYYQAVRVAGEAAETFLAGTDDQLDDAIALLHRVENELASEHNWRSEIRAHRTALESMVPARSADWLRVDDGVATCIFPFGLRHADHAEIVEAVKASGGSWSVGGKALDNSPTRLLLMSDVWRGDDPLKRRYEGTQLALPDLAHMGSGQPVTMKATVIISQLGNHHLRIEIPLKSLRPHELAALIWMSAPEYGELAELGHSLGFAEVAPEYKSWSRLTDFVTDTLAELVAQLEADSGLDVALSFRPGMYHVVTTVNQASVLPGGRDEDARELHDASSIPELFGSQPICHPLPAGLGSIAPWSRYASPVGQVVKSAGLTDEFILVNENQTLLASFSSPDFLVGNVQQVAEFVASLEGMFAGWQDELSEFHRQLTPYLNKFAEAIDAAGSLGVDESEDDLKSLERMQIRLRRFVTSARISQLFIESPALVTSPVIRQTLNELLALNAVWKQRNDFTDVAGAAIGDRLADLVEAWARRRSDRHALRNRRMIDTLLAVVAGIGISGVIAIVQTGYDVKGWGSVVLVFLVVLIATLVGVFCYRWTRGDQSRLKSSPRQNERTSGGPDARCRGNRSANPDGVVSNNSRAKFSRIRT